MICQFKISEFGDFVLEFLNGLVLKLLNFAAIHTNQVVMVVAAVQFKNRIAPFKVVSLD